MLIYTAWFSRYSTERVLPAIPVDSMLMASRLQAAIWDICCCLGIANKATELKEITSKAKLDLQDG